MVHSTEETIAKIIANNAALINHPALNHDNRLLASKIINTVIIALTNHKVSQFSGKVSVRSTRPIVLLSRAITTATRIATQKLATSTHGRRYADIATAAPINKNCIMIFIVSLIKNKNHM
jgi:hypothetical protein